MTQLTPGKIFLADQRGVVETSQFRRYSTFNFGEYAHEHKGPFGRLAAFNEETLAGAHRLALPVRLAAHILLIPVTGSLSFSAGARAMASLEVGEMQLLTLPAGATLHLTNPYETELISFLHIWLQADEPGQPTPAQLFSFDLAAAENQLRVILPPAQEPNRPFGVSIGRFMGRSEAIYQVPAGASFFAFVLAGAFEIEGRLLHEHDGLALWQAGAVEIEALSNHAIVIILDLN